MPYFVYKKDFEKNILYVTQNENKIFESNKNNDEKSIYLKEVNSFTDLGKIDENKIYTCLTKYRGEKYEIKLNITKSINDKDNNVQIKITPISENFFAVSGQSVVVYDKSDVILGGIL